MIIAFPKSTQGCGGWLAGELDALTTLAAPHIAAGGASGWAVRATDAGDPQFFLLGPEPEQDCILAVSRVKGVYVLEDGGGRLVSEHRSLAELGDSARKALRTRKLSFIARIAVGWYAVRQELDEKLDALAGEATELLTHLVPQLATLA